MTAPDPRMDEIHAVVENHSKSPGGIYGPGSDVAYLLAELRKAHEAAADAWDKGMTFAAYLLNAEELTPTFRKDNPYRAAVAAAKGDERG